MFNSATLFTLSDEVIYNIEVHLEIIHSPTQESQNSNDILCKSEIHHNSPYFAITTIPVIYDENIVQEQIKVKCNASTHVVPLNNSFILVQFGQKNEKYEITLLNHIIPTKNDIDEDIDMLLKLILSKSDFTKIICKKYRGMENFSLRGDTDLEFKYLLFSFKDNGSLYHPSYYFDYTMRLLEFIRHEHLIRKVGLFPFLRKFILIVLNYFRSDGLFGPHAVISFYLYYHYKLYIRCLPFDLSFDDDYHNSEYFYFMNFSFIENAISITSQLALIWGYQSKCHDIFMDYVTNLNIKSQYNESLKIMEMRLRESSGVSKKDFENFTIFSREFFPNLIGAHPLSNQLLDYPISLSFIHDLMKLKPLVSFPKDINEVVKFSLPSSTLANTMVSEYINYPENARYDFSNPQVTDFRSSVKQYFISNKSKIEEFIENQEESDIHQLNEPIITSFYGITSLYITQFTNQYDFSKIDLHDLMYISVSKNNPYYVLEKGILYKGYNFNTGKVKGRDQSLCFLVLAARDILSVEIPKSVTCISESAFANCKSLRRVTFEKNSLLKIIEDRAFFECRSLQKINFTDAEFLKEIGDNAFQYSGLTEIQFNESSDLIRVGEYAFSSCEKLEKVEILSKSNSFRQADTELSIKSFAFYKSPIKELKISGVGSIYDYAFANTKLRSVELPTTLNYIGSYVFDNCELESISIPRNINYIPSGIFGKNKNLKIEITEAKQSSKSVLKLGGGSNESKAVRENEGPLPIFFHQHRLCTLFQAIPGISNPSRFLSNVKVKQPSNAGFSKDIFPSSRDNSEMDSKNIIFISPQHDFNNSKLPNETRRILEGAFMKSTISQFNSELFQDGSMPKIKEIYRLSFAYMINLKVVDLADTKIKIIPDFCFFHSTKLTKVQLPITIKSIGRYSFAYTNLHKINLNQLSNLKEIKDYAFYKTQIKKFYVPTSVKYLGSHFYSVSFYQIQEDIQSIDNKRDEDEDNEYEGVEFDIDEEEEEEAEDEEEEEDNEGFDLNNDNGCDEIVKSKNCKIIFMKPSKLTRIESFAFYYSNFNSINLPSSLESIGSYAFSRTNTNPIRIPKLVRRIPDGAFYMSLTLRRVNFDDINNINYIGSNSFTGTNLLYFDVPPNIQFLSDYSFYQTKIETFDFSKSHKLHEIKSKAFSNSKLRTKLPLTTTEIEKDSFVGGAKYEIYDFIGKKTKQIISEQKSTKENEFEDYDEIVLLPENEIDIKRKENEIYSLKNKDEINSNEQQFDSINNCIEMIDDKNKEKKKHFIFRSILTSDNVMLTQINNDLPTNNNNTQICNAVILLYYEIASKQITHISISYINDIFESINSFLFEIDQFTKDIKFVLEKILKHFRLSFINEEDIKILSDFLSFNFESAYSPNHLSKETYSLCKEMNLNISNRPSLFPINDQELERLTTLTTIASIYINIKENMNQESKFQFVFKNQEENLIQLRPITKDDIFEMYLYYDKRNNKIITKEFLKSNSLINNKWFDGYIYLMAKPILENGKISITYDFSLDYLIRDVLNSILRGNLKAGQNPYNNFMKINCIFAYLNIFNECANINYYLSDISSKTLFLNENLIPLFVFIPHKEDEIQYNIDFELKRFWILIYELLTNKNIDDLLLKLINNDDVSSSYYEKLKFRNEFNEMTVFNSNQIKILCQFFNNVVFKICFNFDKFDGNGILNNKTDAFNFMFKEFRKIWSSLFVDVDVSEDIKKDIAQVDNYIKEIVDYGKRSPLKIPDIQ